MDKIEDIKKDIKKFSAIDAVANSDGGKIIIKSTERELVSIIDELASKFKTLNQTEFIALCASLSAKLGLIRTLRKAEGLKKLAKEELEFVINS
jgi:sugar-specific transcriptional regulator TrmB